MIFMEDIIVDYNLDGSITVDYIGSDENKKTIGQLPPPNAYGV